MANVYEPLRSYLASSRDAVVVMTYQDIEKLLGRKLPPTAYGDSWRQWWANTETHSQALAWLRAGFKVASPDLAGRRVEFRRQSSVGTENEKAAGSAQGAGFGTPGSANIVISRDHLTPSALRMIEDAAEEAGGDVGLATAEIFNRAAIARRRQLLDWFVENSHKEGTSSVELIREDRDA